MKAIEHGIQLRWIMLLWALHGGEGVKRGTRKISTKNCCIYACIPLSLTLDAWWSLCWSFPQDKSCKLERIPMHQQLWNIHGVRYITNRRLYKLKHASKTTLPFVLLDGSPNRPDSAPQAWHSTACLWKAPASSLHSMRTGWGETWSRNSTIKNFASIAMMMEPLWG